MLQTIPDSQEVQISPELAEMFKAGMYVGYRKTKRHPNMRQFIFGTKNNVEVFDLSKVQTKLEEALNFIRELGREEKTILFVGTKACARIAIAKIAEALDMPYVTGRWLGGTLTNIKVILERIAYWQHLEEMERTGEIKKYIKQERFKIAKEAEKLSRMFGGLKIMKKLPAALFVVDMGEESIAVGEARKKHIPVVALSNSDTNPDLAAYPIPANDNSKASIEYVLARAEASYREGQALRPVASPEAPLL